jgi:uncharacterized protein YbjT (DUF2867 family)
MTAKILIVGATGTVGTELVAQLREEGHSVRVMTRDPKKAAALGWSTNVEIVKGELNDPASLTQALRGIDVAFLATSPTPRLHEEEGNFIDAAQAAKLSLLVKLSACGIELAPDRIHLCHVESEKRLRASGVPHVILRPTIFMSNLRMDAASIVNDGKLPSVFGDARVTFVDPKDVAALARRALIEPNKYAGASWDFGGPEPLSYDDLAATLTEVLGRRIEHVRVDLKDFAESALRSGLPDFVVEAITESAPLARLGKYAPNDDAVQRVLGRKASPFREWAERNRNAFSN